MEFTVYSKDNCEYCSKAKALLRSKGFSFTPVSLDDAVHRVSFKDKYPHLKTVPQIFKKDGEHIGGYTELEKMLSGVTALKDIK